MAPGCTTTAIGPRHWTKHTTNARDFCLVLSRVSRFVEGTAGRTFGSLRIIRMSSTKRLFDYTACGKKDDCISRLESTPHIARLQYNQFVVFVSKGMFQRDYSVHCRLLLGNANASCPRRSLACKTAQICRQLRPGPRFLVMSSLIAKIGSSQVLRSFMGHLS